MDIPPAQTIDPVRSEMDRLRQRRDQSMWYLVMGTAMLFAGGFHIGLAIGGVFMVAGGAVNYLYWSARLRRIYDPWRDDELDAWEREHFDT